MRAVPRWLVLFLIIACGCAKQNSLVGVWVADVSWPGGVNESFRLTLTSDGKATLLNGNQTPGGGAISITASGTYKSRSADTLTLHFDEVVLDAPDLQDRAAEATSTMFKRYNKEFRLEWTGNDEFVLPVSEKRRPAFKRQPQ